MAVPPDMTIENLNGKFRMNKDLCKKTNEMLKVQGIGMITRTAIGYASVTLHINNYVEGDVRKIDIDQTVIGGLKGTSEKRSCDWNERAHHDHIFENVKGRTRLVHGLENIDVQTHLPDGSKDSKDVEWLCNSDFLDKDGVFLQSWVESTDKNWTAEQVWGFETIGGVKRYSRKIVVRDGNNAEHGWLVYDYLGPLDTKKKEQEGELDVEY
ncbi:MAG: hypothetical protein Q9227_007488 [Pyrenula ochraceoflavens]